jgi:hypothetical protein
MTPRRLEKIQAEGGDIRPLCAWLRRTSERYYLVHSESGFSHDYLIKRHIQYVGRSLKVNDLFCRDAYRISKKREAARYEAQEACRNLTDAFLQMRAGVSEVEAEEVTFSLDEQNLLPTTFSERLSVRISYSWRIDQNADWQFGNIIFSYLA